MEKKSLKVLHVTAHLGGGVGRVLSRVASFRGVSGQPVERTILCLEPTEKEQAVNIIRKAGVRLIVSPSLEESRRLAQEADIVQLEWWHHPLAIEWMVRVSSLRARLVVWSHTSGLHYPAIPRDFVSLPHAFLFTTPVSLRLFDQNGVRDGGNDSNIIDVVHSSGGFGDIPLVIKESRVEHLNYGYLGSLNFAKLHPDIIRYVKAVEVPGFAVDFHGDTFSNPRLKDMASQAGVPERVRIPGYTDSPYEVLAKMDVFVYLLNPSHYGTTENALLEAMACSAVPVVLNNPVESSIVRDGYTGLVVDSPDTFAKAIAFLNDHPDERRKIGEAARFEVMTKYSLEATVEKLGLSYSRVSDFDRRDFEFGKIFGRSPSVWFASCLGEYAPLFHDISGLEFRDQRLLHPVLYERSKSSVLHFLRYYPSDPQLRHWASMLEDDLAAA